MTTIPYWHVDAFADAPFKGNQAAVMPLDKWLPDDVLQAIGEENAFAETAFIMPDHTGEADYELRWFTPTEEVRLCGHATLASGHVVITRDNSDRVTFRTRKAGILEVRRSAAGYELGLPLIPTTQGEWDEAVGFLGAQPQEVWLNPEGYGVYLFENEAAVLAIDPDMRGLKSLGNDQFICTAPGSGTDIVSRVFVPGGGVDEDSFTGSAHAALTWFWTEKLGQDSFTAFQASQRGGHATCRREGNQAWLGGPCATVVKGEFYLP